MPTTRLLRPFAVALLVLAALLPAACAGGDQQGTATLINHERTSRGLPALQVDANASAIAQDWAEHMASTNTLQHNPNLGSAITARVGAGWRTYGENVGYNGSVQEVHSGFMASSGHRANILNGAFDRVGIGVVQRNGVFWVAVVFVGY